MASVLSSGSRDLRTFNDCLESFTGRPITTQVLSELESELRRFLAILKKEEVQIRKVLVALKNEPFYLYAHQEKATDIDQSAGQQVLLSIQNIFQVPKTDLKELVHHLNSAVSSLSQREFSQVYEILALCGDILTFPNLTLPWDREKMNPPFIELDKFHREHQKWFSLVEREIRDLSACSFGSSEDRAREAFNKEVLSVLQVKALEQFLETLFGEVKFIHRSSEGDLAYFYSVGEVSPEHGIEPLLAFRRQLLPFKDLLFDKIEDLIGDQNLTLNFHAIQRLNAFIRGLEKQDLKLDAQFYTEIADLLKAYFVRKKARQFPAISALKLLSTVLSFAPPAVHESLAEALADSSRYLVTPQAVSHLSFLSAGQCQPIAESYELFIAKKLSKHKYVDSTVIKMALSLLDKVSVGGQYFPIRARTTPRGVAIHPLYQQLQDVKNGWRRQDMEASFTAWMMPLIADEFSITEPFFSPTDLRFLINLLVRAADLPLLNYNPSRELNVESFGRLSTEAKRHVLYISQLQGEEESWNVFLRTWVKSQDYAQNLMGEIRQPEDFELHHALEWCFAKYHREARDGYGVSLKEHVLALLVDVILKQTSSAPDRLQMLNRVLEYLIALSQKTGLDDQLDYPSLPLGLSNALYDALKKQLKTFLRDPELRADFSPLSRILARWVDVIFLQTDPELQSEGLRQWLDIFYGLSSSANIRALDHLFRHPRLTVAQAKTLLLEVPTTRALIKQYKKYFSRQEREKLTFMTALRLEFSSVRQSLFQGSLQFLERQIGPAELVKFLSDIEHRRVQEAEASPERISAEEMNFSALSLGLLTYLKASVDAESLTAVVREFPSFKAQEINLTQAAPVREAYFLAIVQLLPGVMKVHPLKEGLEFVGIVSALINDLCQGKDSKWHQVYSTQDQAYQLYDPELLAKVSGVLDGLTPGGSRSFPGINAQLLMSEIYQHYVRSNYLDENKEGELKFQGLLTWLETLQSDTSVRIFKSYRDQASVMKMALVVASMLVFSLSVEGLERSFFNTVSHGAGAGAGSGVGAGAGAGVGVGVRPEITGRIFSQESSPTLIPSRLPGFQTWIARWGRANPSEAFKENLLELFPPIGSEPEYEEERKKLATLIYFSFPSLGTPVWIDPAMFSPFPLTRPGLFDRLSRELVAGTTRFKLISLRVQLFEIFDASAKGMAHRDSENLAEELKRTETFAEFFEVLAAHIETHHETLSEAKKDGEPKRVRAENLVKVYQLLCQSFLRGEDTTVDFREAMGQLVVLSKKLSYGFVKESRLYQVLPELVSRFEVKTCPSEPDPQGLLNYLDTEARTIQTDNRLFILSRVRESLHLNFPSLMAEEDPLIKNLIGLAKAQEKYSALLLLVMICPAAHPEVHFDEVPVIKQWKYAAEAPALLALLVLAAKCDYLGRPVAADREGDITHEDFLSRHQSSVELPAAFHTYDHPKVHFVSVKHRSFNRVADDLSTARSVHEQFMILRDKVLENPGMLKGSRGKVLWQYFYGAPYEGEKLSADDQQQLSRVTLSFGEYLRFAPEKHVSCQIQPAFKSQKIPSESKEEAL